VVTFLSQALGRSHARRLWAWLRSQWSLPLGIALAWFVVAFASICWAEGFRPKTFTTPDEAANRLAGSIISKTGRPFLELPFVDPEDCAHPRAWLSQGDYAIPIYPPVSVYFYALITSLKRIGAILLICLPASGLGAFAAGIARLLPNDRRWLAAFAPALAMPALYWLMRPWMNICGLLTCVCWAFYFFMRWRTGGGKHALTAAMLCVGLGAAVRPDYTSYLLLVTLLVSFSAEPSSWRRLLVLTALAGAFALALNLFFNRLVTGNPFRAAYQMAMDADPAAPRAGALARFAKLLFFPMAFAGWRTVGETLFKYWFLLQPLWILALGQLTLVPFLRARPLRERLTLGVVLLLLVLFMVSRVDPMLFGLERDKPWIQDSVPRYWTPIYLLACVPALWFVGRTRRRWAFGAGVAAVSVLALVSLASVYSTSSQSLRRQRKLANQELGWLDELERIVPPEAIVYSVVFDKVLWSRFRAGHMENLELAADSMARALGHELPVYMWAHWNFKPELPHWEDVLESRGLRLVLVNRKLHFYRVVTRS